MKKLLAAMLSLSMAGAGVAFPVSATEVLTIDEATGVYANEEEIIVPFSADISAVTDEVLKNCVSIKDSSENDILFSGEIEGKNLIIKLSQPIKRDSVYSLSISDGFQTSDAALGGSVTKSFKVKTLVETDFANASSISDYIDLVVQPGTGNAKAGLSGASAFVSGGDNIAYVRGNYADEEKYTAKFSLYMMGNATLIAFNEQQKQKAFYAQQGTGFGWIAGKLVAQSSDNKTLYRAARGVLPYDEKYFGFTRYGTCDVADQSAYIKESNPPVWTDSTNLTPDSFFKPNQLKIDKFGTSAKLYILNNNLYTLLDTHDTTAYGLESTPKTGYLGIGTSGQNIAFGDILITAYEEMVAGEELFAEDNIYANEDSITIPFNASISSVGAVTVKNTVSLKDAEGNDMDYTYQVNGMNLTVSPIGGFTRDAAYTITIGAGFGAAGVEVKTDIVKNFMVATVAATNFAQSGLVTDYMDLSNQSTATAVADGVALVKGGQTVAYLKGDYNKLENYTATFDLYKIGNATSITFNAQSTAQGTSSGAPQGYGWTAVGWFGNNGTQTRFIRSYKGKGIGQTDDQGTHLATSSGHSEIVWGDTVTVPSLVPNHIKLEKQGEIGKLYIKNGNDYSLKDTFDTFGLDADVSSPATGYLGIGTDSQIVGFGDIVITAYQEMQYGDITFNAEEDIYASTTSIRVPFEEDISQVNNAASKISLSDVYGNNVPCTTQINGKVLTIVPSYELERDLAYSLTIEKGFGYSAVTLKDKVARSFKVKTVAATDLANADNILQYFDLAVQPGGENENVYAGIYDGTAYLKGGNNMAYVKGDYTNLEDYTVSFSMYMSGNTNFITFNDEAQRITQYAFNAPGAGYGWAAVGWFDGNKKFARSYRETTGTDFGFAKFASATQDSSALIAASDAIPDGGWSDNTTIESLGKINKENHMKIDKFGTRADFYIMNGNGEYQLVDCYETMDCGQGADTPKSGYFGIGTGTLEVGFGDVIITTTEFIQGSISVEDYEIRNSDTGELVMSSLDGVSNVNGYVYINSSYAQDMPAAVVAAAFNGKKMLKADVLNISKIGNGSTELEFSLSGISGATQIKFFVWDSMGSMIPYTGAEEVF